MARHVVGHVIGAAPTETRKLFRAAQPVDDVALLRQVGQIENAYALGDSSQALRDRLYVFAPTGSLSGNSTTSAPFRKALCSGLHLFAPPAQQVAGKPKSRMRSTFFSPSATQTVCPAAIAFATRGADKG